MLRLSNTSYWNKGDGILRLFFESRRPVVGMSCRRLTIQAGGLRINRCFPQFSRTEVDRLVEKGRICVNDAPARLGTRLLAGDSLTLDGKDVRWQDFAELKKLHPYPDGLRLNNGFVYLKYFKGTGVNTTTSTNDPDGVLNTGHFRNVSFPADGAEGRLMPVGRLDRMSTGVLLLSSDSRLSSWLLGANTGCSKVYHVLLDRPPASEHLKQWAAGVAIATPSSSGRELRTHPTLPCKVRALGAAEAGLAGRTSSLAPASSPGSSNSNRWVEFELKEGRNRQVRRMVHALGYTVKALHRPSFCGVGLDGLRGPGLWAPLTEAELQRLRNRK